MEASPELSACQLDNMVGSSGASKSRFNRCQPSAAAYTISELACSLGMSRAGVQEFAFADWQLTYRQTMRVLKGEILLQVTYSVCFPSVFIQLMSFGLHPMHDQRSEDT